MSLLTPNSSASPAAPGPCLLWIIITNSHACRSAPTAIQAQRVNLKPILHWLHVLHLEWILRVRLLAARALACRTRRSARTTPQPGQLPSALTLVYSNVFHRAQQALRSRTTTRACLSATMSSDKINIIISNNIFILVSMYIMQRINYCCWYVLKGLKVKYL